MIEISGWNLIGGFFCALIATGAVIEARSSSLVPKSLLLWPIGLILYGIATLLQAWVLSDVGVYGMLGAVLILCGFQALLVNLRRTAAWPSGVIWLGLVIAGLVFETKPLVMDHLVGFIWIATGVTKVLRERSASLEAGTPMWILLLYAQAILLASYR